MRSLIPIWLVLAGLVAPPGSAITEGTLVALGGSDFGWVRIEAPSLLLTTATPPTGNMGREAALI